MYKWGYDGDMKCWLAWAKYMREMGLTNIYDNPNKGCDYLPAYLYILWFHGKIQGTMKNLEENLYVIKWITLIFDFLGAYLAVWYVKDKIKKVAYFIFLMLNVAYVYNTVQWGQVDAIHTFFGFAAIIAALEKRVVISVSLFLIAANFKMQSIVFVPILGLLLLPQTIASKKTLQTLFVALIVAALVQLIILFPFIIKGKVDRVLYVVTHLTAQFPHPSVCAFNIWFWLFPNTNEWYMYDIDDSTKFGFLSLRLIGNIMFLTTMFIAVFPLMKYLYQKYFQKKSMQFPIEKIFLMSALVSVCFFFFNTQMHERYVHPALIAIAAYAFCSTNNKRFFPLVLASIAYFLNLEKPLKILSLTNYGTLIFNPKFVAVLWAILIAFLFYMIYSKKENYNKEALIDI
jgi:Gpi18-like mannosyltransferase